MAIDVKTVLSEKKREQQSDLYSEFAGMFGLSEEQNTVEIIPISQLVAYARHVKHFMIEKYRMFYEFRIKVSGKAVRIIFCERGSNIILLYAFYKRGKRDTENALNYTLNLLKKLDEKVLMPYERLCEVDAL